MLPPFILYPSYHDDVKKYISKFPKQIDWIFSIPSSTDKEYFSMAMLEELFSPGKSQHKFYHHLEDDLHLIGVEIYSTDYVVVKYTFVIWLLKTLKLIRI